MNITTDIRIRYFNKLNGLEHNGVAIPVFDEVVTTSGVSIGGAEVYIVLQDQQSFDAPIQTYCDYDIASEITVRVVTKYGLVGSKRLCEDIAKKVDNLIRNGRVGNHINLKNVELVNSRVISETSLTATAYSCILTYRNTTAYE